MTLRCAASALLGGRAVIWRGGANVGLTLYAVTERMIQVKNPMKPVDFFSLIYLRLSVLNLVPILDGAHKPYNYRTPHSPQPRSRWLSTHQLHCAAGHDVDGNLMRLTSSWLAAKPETP